MRWEETPAGVEARLGGVLIDRYGSDEPAWVEAGTLEWTRTDGSALPPRTEALIKQMYGDTASQRLIDSVY